MRKETAVFYFKALSHQGLRHSISMSCFLGPNSNPEPPKYKKRLYGCETWYFTLREEQSVFENRVLRRIFGHKRGSGRRLEKTA
jgi:hypothetical protein